MKNWFLHDIEECDGSNKFWDWSVEKILVFVGWGMLTIILLGYLAIWRLAPQQFGQVTCFFRIVLGIYCPVCGCSRAALYMITGHLIKSLYFNAVVPVGSLICIPFLILNTLCYLTNGRIKGMRYHNVYAFIILGVTIVNFVWKNYMLLYKGIALIP